MDLKFQEDKRAQVEKKLEENAKREKEELSLMEKQMAEAIQKKTSTQISTEFSEIRKSKKGMFSEIVLPGKDTPSRKSTPRIQYGK